MMSKSKFALKRLTSIGYAEKYVVNQYGSKTIASWNELVPNGKSFYAGNWQSSISGKMFSVINPATGECLRSVPALSSAETKKSIEVAIQSQKHWSNVPPIDRANIIRKWADVIRNCREPLALLITAENGKSLKHAQAEVMSAVLALEWYAEEAKRIYGTVVPSLKSSSSTQMIVHQPVGLVGVITPWNFPLSMITRKVGAALASGCGVILKPAEDTPLSALAITYLGVEEAMIPSGLLHTLTATREPDGAEAIVNELCSNALIRLIGFTGSTQVGKLIYQKAASYGKRVQLEMGGNAPFIVFDSADVDKALEGLVACKFRCSGQTCISANRIFVHERIYDEFVGKLEKLVSNLIMDQGTNSNANLGPLINEKSLEKVERLVQLAHNDGAVVVCGGLTRLAGFSPSKLDYSKGFFFPPTILTNCHSSMACVNNEVFGPVAPIVKFKTDDEVVQLANATPYGLAAYVYTRHLGQAWRMSREIEAGMVGLNTGFVSTAELPFGGIKDSGIGREGGPQALVEFMNTKTVTWETNV